MGRATFRLRCFDAWKYGRCEAASSDLRAAHVALTELSLREQPWTFDGFDSFPGVSALTSPRLVIAATPGYML